MRQFVGIGLACVLAALCIALMFQVPDVAREVGREPARVTLAFALLGLCVAPVSVLLGLRRN